MRPRELPAYPQQGLHQGSQNRRAPSDFPGTSTAGVPPPIETGPWWVRVIGKCPAALHGLRHWPCGWGHTHTIRAWKAEHTPHPTPGRVGGRGRPCQGGSHGGHKGARWRSGNIPPSSGISRPEKWRAAPTPLPVLGPRWPRCPRLFVHGEGAGTEWPLPALFI